MLKKITNNPYFRLCRLDKPVGIGLLLVPCLWGVWVAPHLSYLDISYVSLINTSFLLMIGSLVMRSAGCVINDILDKDFDKHVARTQSRPIASGEISVKQAFVFFALLCLLGLVVLLQLPQIAIHIGLLSFVPLVIYPLMKRITFFPQVFLGLTFNLGIIIGFVSILESFDSRILWLYACGVFITIGYDTVYAFQDIDDDKKIGVKSTARQFEKHAQLSVILFYLVAMICLLIFFYTLEFHLLKYLMACLLFIIIIHQVRKWDIHNKNATIKLFKGGLYLLVSILFILI